MPNELLSAYVAVYPHVQPDKLQQALSVHLYILSLCSRGFACVILHGPQGFNPTNEETGLLSEAQRQHNQGWLSET